ncbi:MAG TPA: hypothetical protein VEX63_03160, partial [Flavisolibacter sp.]|nr:hypothetical protein [Flavisolibacter sp.]
MHTIPTSCLAPLRGWMNPPLPFNSLLSSFTLGLRSCPVFGFVARPLGSLSLKHKNLHDPVITVKSESQLSPVEVTHLRSVLGKQVIRLESSSLSVWHHFHAYQFDQEIKIITEDGIVDVIASYTETHFGDDFHKLHIAGSPLPPPPRAPSTTPSSCLWLGDNFIVSAIQVLGPRYESFSANDKTPNWSIEKQHPGIPIREIIDLSYVLIFHATNAQRMMIRPITAASIIA